MQRRCIEGKSEMFILYTLNTTVSKPETTSPLKLMGMFGPRCISDSVGLSTHENARPPGVPAYTVRDYIYIDIINSWF